MSKKKNLRLEFDLSIVDLLACPACHGSLNLDAPSSGGSSRLICIGCDRVYPIVDGIPLMIAERVAETEP